MNSATLTMVMGLASLAMVGGIDCATASIPANNVANRVAKPAGRSIQVVRYLNTPTGRIRARVTIQMPQQALDTFVTIGRDSMEFESASNAP